METLILLLFLALSDKNDGMKESLNRFLCFYKENRELIQTVTNLFSVQKGEAQASQNAPAPDCGHEESRPREEVGNMSILEEYLRRANA